MSDPRTVLDRKLIAEQSKLNQRRRAYLLARGTTSTHVSSPLAVALFRFGVVLALLVCALLALAPVFTR